jgi:RNA polymerase sigma factor (sigma-70 family)
MVLGVCRRVLGDFHDAEDAFQATFLVLARKAASVVKGESVGCWLYGVAYRTAREASALRARRRARERPMKDIAHPEVVPAEAQDWRPLLDRELSRLPEKYRAAVVLCDLEGRTRREAARLLGLCEGTLSSRLATARQMLARRLARCGLALSGGALAAALSQGATSAQVPAALVSATAKAALLVAAGQMTAVSTPAVVLMKGVMKAMLLKKLRLAVGAVLVLVALGAVGLASQAGGASGAPPADKPDKPANELEALRKENELMKLNLQVVLEKVRAQEAELQTVRKELAAAQESNRGVQVNLNTLRWRLAPQVGIFNTYDVSPLYFRNMTLSGSYDNVYGLTTGRLILNEYLDVQPSEADGVSDATRKAECAIKELREAKDKEGQRRAAEALDKAMKKLKAELKK